MRSSEPGARQLLLLRHAKSDWAASSQSDHERPLSARGRRSAAELATTFARRDLTPELVICSSATRTVETYQALRTAIPSASVEFAPEVYLASAEELLLRLNGIGSEVRSVLLIGHNPGISELASLLDPLPSAESDDLPTAALVNLHVHGCWSSLGRGGAATQEVLLHRGTRGSTA